LLLICHYTIVADMTGTIKAAKRFMPKVKVIQVYEDNKESIFYIRFGNNKWEVRVVSATMLAY
jgi:hypothetical protein